MLVDDFPLFLVECSGAGFNNAVWIGMDWLLSLKLTASLPLKIGRAPKGNVIFQLFILGVSC